MFVIYIIIFIILFLFIFNFIQFKKIKLPNVYLITGGVKTGKSFVNTWLAIKRYKLNLFQYHLKKIIFPKKNIERPMLYSNIPLSRVKYNMLTIDILKREARIPHKSVVFIDEASLLADSMDFQNKITNEEITLFVKLFGHYSHGGYLIYNTQDLKDVHFGFKRCTSTMLWIHSKKKIPLLFTILKVRELISMSDDNVSAENNFTNDVESDCLTLIIPNKYYKYYDCYAFSSLTDNKTLKVNYNKKKHKEKRKAKYIVSFRKFRTFDNSEVFDYEE